MSWFCVLLAKNKFTNIDEIYKYGCQIQPKIHVQYDIFNDLLVIAYRGSTILEIDRCRIRESMGNIESFRLLNEECEKANAMIALLDEF